MWSNADDEFFNDLDVMSEIWESKQVRNEPSFLQENSTSQSQNIRSNLIDESDEEDEKDNLDDIFEDENNPERISLEIQRQIAEATGNVHSNKVQTDYWQTTNTDKKISTFAQSVNIDFDKKESGFVVQSNFNIEKLKPVEVQQVSENKPKTTGLRKTKKKSVADAIQTSLVSKNMSEPVREISPKRDADIVSPVRKKENLMQLPSFMGMPRKILSTESVSRNNQPSNRFSLPIHGDGYRDYYSGAKFADYSETDDFSLQQNGNWFTTDSERSSDTYSYVSDQYSYQDDFSSKTTHSSDKIINLNSDIDFPPLS